MNQFILAFITGLTSGGLSCFAVQGGLLTSALTSKNSNKFFVTNAFFVSKLVAITALGAILGFFGEKVLITPKFQGLMQLFAGMIMLLTAGRLLKIHPIFNKFDISPPKNELKLSRNFSRINSFYAPILLGLSTVLIPCGITQGMMVWAVGSGSAQNGALIMSLYTLGTAPVFYALGFTSEKLSNNKAFSVIASLLLIFLGLTSINTGQVLRGSVHTFANYYNAFFSDYSGSESKQDAEIENGVQKVTINVVTGGYNSNTTKLKSGIPVLLKLVTDNTRGCSRAFTIPSINYSKVLPETGVEYVEFTPSQKGRLVYTCSMGMYSGYFDVV